MSSRSDDALAHAVAQLAQGVQALLDRVQNVADRVQALESARFDLERKHEVVQAAGRSWRALLRAQGDLVLASEAGVVARLPVPLARVLAAGRAADVEVRDVDAETVALVGVQGREITTLPRAALLALPRVLSQPDTTRLLALGVSVQPGQTPGHTTEARS